MVISLKRSLADYSYGEFRSIVEALTQATGSRDWQDRLLEHFIEVVAHPDGADLSITQSSSRLAAPSR